MDWASSLADRAMIKKRPFTVAMMQNPYPISIFPQLTIITVNLNLEQDTVECLQSLIQAGATREQLIVVDNGSQEGSVRYIRQYFKEPLTILVNPENLGYASGLNLGICKFLENENSQWALLINNDTLVAEDFLVNLETIVKQGEYQLLGPAIYYKDNPDKIWALGDRLIPGTMLSYHLLKEKTLTQTIENPLPVDILNGCAMLIHRSVFENVGLFDTFFFMYAEEVDFCWRARKKGYKMACVSTAKMWHKVSASANRTRDYSLYLKIRNQIYFYRRYSNILQAIFMFLFSSLRNAIWMMKFMAAGLPLSAKSVFRGWYNGWFH